MKSVKLIGKVFNERELKDVVIGGQNNADSIRFVLPKVFEEGLDLSLWTWYISYENKNGTGDNALLTATVSADGSLLYLDWKPSTTATQVEGRLKCQVFGLSSDGNSRFSCAPFATWVHECLEPSDITEKDPSYIEAALAVIAKQVTTTETYKTEAAASAELAKQWATGEGEIETGLYSSKHYAEDAAASLENVLQSEINVSEMEGDVETTKLANDITNEEVASQAAAVEKTLSEMQSLKVEMQAMASAAVAPTAIIDDVVYTLGLVASRGRAWIGATPVTTA